VPSTDSSVDLVTLGRRLRHRRRERGLTLDGLAGLVGCAPSHLSLVENGRREPRLTLLNALADALGVPVAVLLAPDAPSPRAALEIAFEHAQRSPLYQSLGLPPVRTSRRLPTEALEALLGLHDELVRRLNEQAATPEEARRANAELRRDMRSRDNYYEPIEKLARELLDAIGHTGGPLPQRGIAALASHLGFSIHHVNDLPHSTRSVTDMRNHRIYAPPPRDPSDRDVRRIVLQTMGHVVLGHVPPRNYADFLRQRIEANYFAAALLVPEHDAVDLLQRAKDRKELSIDDLQDAFAVSYETAAHRFTNLATRHLGLPVHFVRIHESGTIYKAYENDGLIFPADVTGAIEGQTACRHWTGRTVFSAGSHIKEFAQYTDTPSGTYWCTARTEATSSGQYSVTTGVPYAHVKWFRDRDTTARSASTCPDEKCCALPPASLSSKWQSQSWPSARAQSHLLAALPPGTFPGVDDTEVYQFLEDHAPVG
jgi:predicted transcriptional regulator/DNA-binding XRE family transcriptional regulator